MSVFFVKVRKNHYLCVDVVTMKLRFFLLVIVALVLLTGCERDATALLERAEAYLPSKPDSAEVCLDSIGQPQRLNDAQKAWYGLLRTYVDNRQDKGVDSDSLIRDSYEYYREASHTGQTSDMTLLRRYAQSCYYMALYYSSCDSIKQCEDLLNQAIKGSKKSEDWHTCYLAHIILSNSTVWSNQKYAIQESLKALDVYYKISDDVNNEVLILGKIASTFLAGAQPDSALKYYIKGYELAEKNHLKKTQNNICMGLARIYRYLDDYEKALDYARRGITTADSTVLVSSLLTLAQCYQDCDSLDKAKEILYTIPYDSVDYLNKYLILRNLSEIAIQSSDYDSLYVYVDSAYESLEDRFWQSQRVKDEYYQANLAKELEKEQLQHEKEMSWWIGCVIILFLSLIAAFIIYNVWKNKQHLVAEHEKEMQHQQELLHQKSKTHAVLQKHFMEKLAYSRKLIADGEKAHMRGEDWKEMEHLIDDTDNNFVQKLRQQYKGLKEEDVRLCMLVRLKMTNAIIANVFYIGESAVKKRKSVLKKTGFQITDPNISLEQVIENL